MYFRFLLITVLVVGFFLFPGISAQARQKGAITGKVELSLTAQVAKRERSSHYRTPVSAEVGATASKEKRPEVTNVVVYLEGERFENLQREPGVVVLDQRDATFLPHVLPIVKGTTVRFVNRDKTYHNVFSLSSPKKFNIGRRPTGEEVPVTFEKDGPVQVFCDIHSHMSAFILVMDNSLFVQPKADGTFVLRDVPPGGYTIQVWHERLTAAPQTITVKAGETVTVNFNMQ